MILPPIRTLAGRMRPAKLNRPDANRTTRPRGGGELLLAGCVVSNRRTRARAGETARLGFVWRCDAAAPALARGRRDGVRLNQVLLNAAPALARGRRNRPAATRPRRPPHPRSRGGRQARWSTRPTCWAVAPALARGRRTDWLGSLDNAMPHPSAEGARSTVRRSCSRRPTVLFVGAWLPTPCARAEGPAPAAGKRPHRFPPPRPRGGGCSRSSACRIAAPPTPTRRGPTSELLYSVAIKPSCARAERGWATDFRVFGGSPPPCIRAEERLSIFTVMQCPPPHPRPRGGGVSCASPIP